MARALIVNGEPKDCSICWEETKTKHFQTLMDAPHLDELKAFAILLDTEFDELAQDRSEMLTGELYPCVAYVFNQPQEFRDAKHDRFITLRGKRIELPAKLEALTVEQNMYLFRCLYQDKRPLETLISTAIAVYLQPLVMGGKFNFDEAMKLKAEIEEMPIGATFPIGFFYLSKLNNYGTSGLLYWFRRKLISLLLKIKFLRRLKWISLLHLMVLLSLISMQNDMGSYQEKSTKNALTISFRSLSYGSSNENTEKELLKLRSNLKMQNNDDN
jgi:hypothetical protein